MFSILLSRFKFALDSWRGFEKGARTVVIGQFASQRAFADGTHETGEETGVNF